VPQVDINWLWVLIGAITAMVIGAAWYAIFAEPWMKAAGLAKKDMKNVSTGMNYLWAFIFALISTWTLAWFVGLASATTFGNGAIVGFWVWIVVAAAMAGNTLWEQRSWSLWLLNAGNTLFTFLVVAGLLAMYPAM